MPYEGRCHCGHVGWTLHVEPQWLTRCNCSYCRRSGALWAHVSEAEISLHGNPADRIRYTHGEATLAFVSCRHCGCTTHWENLSARSEGQKPEETRMAVNAAMLDPDQISHLRVRHFDGADSWDFLD
ncbi:GFA family protein [Maricaulis virginensis]|uniref:GFA family protein n=1 Tax=Maricaulis virginensis TaxID=144022 RepID=UPI0022F273DF|nr:hypothetical protein [Maricaulis virginensis]